MKFGLEVTGISLKAPSPPDAPSAVLGKSYHCSLPLVYSAEDATLTFPDIQVGDIAVNDDVAGPLISFLTF